MPLTIRIEGDHPFRSDSSNLVQDLKYLGAYKDQKVTFDVMPSPLAQNRIYEFDVVFEYPNENGETVTNKEKAYVEIDNNLTEPIISVSKVTCNVDPAPVDVANSINISLLNTGGMKANNVKVKLVETGVEGIMLYNDSATKIIDEIPTEQTKNVYFVIKPSKYMTPGEYKVDLEIEYSDELGTKYEKRTLSAYINIGKSDYAGNLELVDVIYPAQVAEAQDFNVLYKIKNNSNKTLSGIVANFQYDNTVFVAKKDSKVFVEPIPAGETREVVVNMAARKDIANDTHHCYIVLKNGEAEKAPELLKEYVGIYVDSTHGSGNRPKLIVEKYDYGKKAKAGEDFDLVLYIKNTSETQATKNIKISLTSADGVFVPVDSSSSLYIDYIGPGETKTATMRYKTKIDAEVKIYSVGVKMEYEDGNGKAFDAKNNPFSEEESLSLFVYQDTVLSVGDPMMDFEVYAGDSMNIDIEFYNEGRSKMTNLKVRVEGVPVRENSYYVGNFDAGQNDSFSITIDETEEGDYEGKFIFEYQNPMGEKGTKEVPFAYFVMPASEKPNPKQGEMDMMPSVEDDEENKAIDWTMWGMIGGGALLLLIIVIVVIRKHKKKMQNLKELEDVLNE